MRRKSNRPFFGRSNSEKEERTESEVETMPITKFKANSFIEEEGHAKWELFRQN